jgi:hypothetical protein
MLTGIGVLALLLLFGLLFCALWRKRRVRATFKGPFGTVLVEFEADDGKRDHEGSS